MSIAAKVGMDGGKAPSEDSQAKDTRQAAENQFGSEGQSQGTTSQLAEKRGCVPYEGLGFHKEMV
jgi:hypothetical protein